MPKTIRSDLTVEVGDIVRVDLDPTIGQEQRKTRPCLIVEAGGSPLDLVITLPITDGRFRPESKTFVPLEDWKAFGLRKRSAVDCYQIRSLSSERIIEVLGKVDGPILFEVRRRLANFLDIGEEHVLS